MRIYKKIAALALSGVMTLGLMAGCSTTETETTPTTAPTVNQATSPTESEGASEANGLNAPITVISREEGSGTRGHLWRLWAWWTPMRWTLRCRLPRW